MSTSLFYAVESPRISWMTLTVNVRAEANNFKSINEYDVCKNICIVCKVKIQNVNRARATVPISTMNSCSWLKQSKLYEVEDFTSPVGHIHIHMLPPTMHRALLLGLSLYHWEHYLFNTGNDVSYVNTLLMSLSVMNFINHPFSQKMSHVLPLPLTSVPYRKGYVYIASYRLVKSLLQVQRSTNTIDFYRNNSQLK